MKNKLKTIKITSSFILESPVKSGQTSKFKLPVWRILIVKMLLLIIVNTSNMVDINNIKIVNV